MNHDEGGLSEKCSHKDDIYGRFATIMTVIIVDNKKDEKVRQGYWR